MTTTVSSLYKSVIEDVINNVREAFLDEGVDEQALLELKQVWENKLAQSRAVPPENPPEPQAIQPQYTLTTQNAAAKRKSAAASAAANAAAHQQQSVVQPQAAVHYHYPSGEMVRNLSKTVTITLPHAQAGSKPVTIALPTMIQQGGGLVMSTSAATAASALPPNIAAGLLQSQIQLNPHGVYTQQNSDGTTVQFQAVSAEQLVKQGYTISVPQNTQQQQQPQQPQTSQVQLNSGGIIQLDGVNDTSDEEEDDDDFKDGDDDGDDDNDVNDDENDATGEEEVEPLNSEDDVSDEDPSELFDTDNVIVCQYDKITRSRNKWKFHLKDGIMNLQGKDYVFQKANGDAEW